MVACWHLARATSSIVNGSFCNLCALALWLRYTVLTSPKKGEAAVHCCDLALSDLVMLVSRNVFHVVSALQSIVTVVTTDWTIGKM